MEMTDCQRFFCGFGSSSKIVSQAVPNFGSAMGETAVTTFHRALSSGWRESANTFPFRSAKVSIRLFNSILNL